MPKLPPKHPPPDKNIEKEDQKLNKILELALTKVTRNPSKASLSFIVPWWNAYRNLDPLQNGRESRRETRCSQQEDPTDSPHPFLNQRRSVQSDNIVNLSDIPPVPPPPAIPKLTPAQIRLRRAVHVDKFSRVGFPLTFAILNCTYWYMFYEYI
jgi:hypothetical protein